MENCNSISLTSKYEAEDKDELAKAMKLFNLEDKEDGRKRSKKDKQRRSN